MRYLSPPASCLGHIQSLRAHTIRPADRCGANVYEPPILVNCVIASDKKPPVFQLAYTSLFGFHCAYLFLRTGSLLPPTVSHVFCNIMGLPQYGAHMETFPKWRRGERLRRPERSISADGTRRRRPRTHSRAGRVRPRRRRLRIHHANVGARGREPVLARSGERRAVLSGKRAHGLRASRARGETGGGVPGTGERVRRTLGNVHRAMGANGTTEVSSPSAALQRPRRFAKKAAGEELGAHAARAWWRRAPARSVRRRSQDKGVCGRRLRADFLRACLREDIRRTPRGLRSPPPQVPRTPASPLSVLSPSCCARSDRAPDPAYPTRAHTIPAIATGGAAPHTPTTD